MTDRFAVIYRIFAPDRAAAEERAACVALEDTLEIPRNVVPTGYIADVVLGRVGSLEAVEEGIWNARILYHIDAVGHEFPQFLNVVLGNASILKGVKAIDLEPNHDVRVRFPGARFGAAGVRRLAGCTGGYVCPVIKPQGSSASELAQLCYLTARAGAAIIKEDHGLANQRAAPFDERIARCVEAVARANAERAASGDTAQALFFANILGHGDQICDMAFAARDAGVDGILLIPGLLGFDAINRLARNPGFGLPIMAHPSHLGPYVLDNQCGYGHGMLLGTLMRLAGADISVFPNFGGRFGFSRQECCQIVHHCRRPDGPGPAILPSPGGGMSPERLAGMVDLYGAQCVYLLGGSLLAVKDRIGDTVSQIRRQLEQAAQSGAGQ